MKTLASIAVLCAAASVAHAQAADGEVELTTADEAGAVAAPLGPPIAPAEVSLVEQMTKTARNLARDRHCESLASIGTRVRTLDADYYTRVYAIDPAIASCGVVSPIQPRPAVDATERHTDSRSPGFALALSGGSFIAGVVMTAEASDHSTGQIVAGLAAMAIGPTLGHIYAGEVWNRGLEVRLISLGIAALGTGIIVAGCMDSCEGNGGSAALGLLAVGGASIGYAAGTLYEIGDATTAAQRFNQRHPLAVVPVAAGSPGVSVAGTF